MNILGRLLRALHGSSRTQERLRVDVEDELALHVDLRAEALERTGLSPGDARAQALREFGDVQDAATYCVAMDQEASRRRRRVRWWGDLRQDVAHAARTMRRAPAFAAATVLTLALACGATTAIWSVVNTYLLRALPFPDADRLMWVHDAPTLDRFPNAPSLRDIDWTGADALFDGVANFDLDGFILVDDRSPDAVTGAWITGGYFDILGARPALGRTFTPEEYAQDAPVAIISHALWVRRWGADPRVIGATVTAHSNDRPGAPPLVTIVGVMPRGFWPIQWREGDFLRPLRRGTDMPALVRLSPRETRTEAEQRLDAYVRAQLVGEVDAAWHMSLMPALARHSARARPLLLSVLGAAVFMLLAACASVAGALVSRMTGRRAEVALRVALGGSRSRIIRQLLTESAVLATLAGVLGLSFAWVLLEVGGPGIERQIGTRVPGGIGMLRPTFTVMLQALALSTCAGVALGLVPAVGALRQISAGSVPLNSAARGATTATSGSRLRRALVASQVAVAMVLLFGAGLMVRTIARIVATDPGFRTENVLTTSFLLPQARYGDAVARREVVDRVLTSLEETEGVRSAAAVFSLPFWPAWPSPIHTEDAPDAEGAPAAAVYTVTPHYFDALDLRVVGGRTFRSTDDVDALPVAVVSEGLARLLSGTGDVIGRRVRVRVHGLTSFDDADDESWHTVVGIVEDTRKGFDASGAAEQPDIYVPVAQHPRGRQGLVVHTAGDPRLLEGAVREAIARVDPLLVPASLETLADAAAAESAQRRGLAVLLGGFAVFALALSALALYASLSYTVRQRRTELAVRMAIGASGRAILRLVTIEAVLTAGVGLLLGLIASLALGRVLRAQVFGVGTADPVTLATISVVLAAVAVSACIAPGLRALRTDPALALRE